MEWSKQKPTFWKLPFFFLQIMANDLMDNVKEFSIFKKKKMKRLYAKSISITFSYHFSLKVEFFDDDGDCVLYAVFQQWVSYCLYYYVFEWVLCSVWQKYYRNVSRSILVFTLFVHTYVFFCHFETGARNVFCVYHIVLWFNGHVLPSSISIYLNWI